MNNLKKHREKTLRMVQMSILFALVLVFQIFLGSFVRIGPAEFAIVLIPITLGAMLLGPASGAFLGLALGVVVLIQGITGISPFTYILFTNHPIITALVCLVKSTVAGFVGGLLYKMLSKKSRIAATFACAAAVPIINTGLFILGGLFMSDTLSANFVADGSTVIYFLVIGCAGWNFIGEFLANMVAAPAMQTIYDVVKNKRTKV